MNFNSMGLSASILKALEEQEYKKPSPIQSAVIPAVLEGKDVMAAAPTGTGKTAGFTLPILEKLSTGERAQAHEVRTLVLTPTRELAAQVAESISAYGKHLSLRTAVAFGGVNINPQMIALRKGVDILVGTPGRLLDLYNQRAMKFNKLEVLVLDEADRMLDMGFIHDIKKIMALLPKKRQNLMFSATFSTQIRELAKGLMNHPVEISVSPPNSTVASVDQWVYTVDKKQKPALLAHLIWENRWEQVLVFAKTKHGANRLTEYLEEDGITAVAIHGNKSQGARTKALANFKKGGIRALVATDIAARGLDIELLPHVINFDLPHIPEDYVHRIGRTGRAGATGEAISLVSADEVRLLRDIERLIKKTLPRKTIDSFEPKHEVPASGDDNRPVSSGRRNSEKPYASRSNAPARSDRSSRSFSDRKPRGDYADRKPRSDSDRSPRTFTDRKPRGDSEGGSRSFSDRKPRADYADRKPRSDSDRSPRTFTDRKPRGDSEGGSRSFSDRKPRADYADRKPRSDSDRSPRTFTDRKPRGDSEGGSRSFSDRKPRGDYADRKPRSDSDRSPRTFTDRKPRGDSEGGSRSFSDRKPRADYADRKPRSDSDRSPRTFTDRKPRGDSEGNSRGASSDRKPHAGNTDRKSRSFDRRPKSRS